MKKTGISLPFLVVCLAFTLIFVIKERVSPSKAISIEAATNLELSDVLRILTTSRNESYVTFLSAKTAALMFSPHIAKTDFKYLAKALADEKAYMAIAKTSYNLPIGFILARQLSQRTMFIDFLFVLPEFQSRKVGRNLISHAFFHAKHRYPETSYLQVEVQKEHTRAANFYFKQGFKIVKQYPELDYTVLVLLKDV